MHQCSKKLATSKEHCCFDHSDFPAHSMFTSDVSSGTQVQPQVILDPDYLPGYLSVSHDDGEMLIYGGPSRPSSFCKRFLFLK